MSLCFLFLSTCSTHTPRTFHQYKTQHWSSNYRVLNSPSSFMLCSGVAPHLIGFGSSFISFDQSAPPKISGSEGDTVSPSPPQAQNELLVPLTLGCALYNQVLLFSFLGAVKAVPDNCSVYSPRGTTRGLFRPCGSAPGYASDSK